MRDNFRTVAIEAALKSGLLIKRSVGKVTGIAYKGKDNIVTDVDKRCEDIIINKIRSSFPVYCSVPEKAS